jgi:Ca2+-binding RTX toxin-like protein
MLFRRTRRDRDLETQLRAARPQPSEELVRAIAARVETRAGSRVRLAVAGALTVVMLVGLASFGGAGYAASAAKQAARSVKRAIAPQGVVISAKPTAAADQYKTGDKDDKIKGDKKKKNDIDAGGGNNDVETGDADDKVKTGSGNDKLVVGSGNNTVNAGDGKNVIVAGVGNNSIKSGKGDDKITVAGGNNKIDVGGGNNDVRTGDGKDAIKLGSGDDVVVAGGGSDTITSAGGNNKIDAGPGNDKVTTGKGSDKVVAGPGRDRVATGGGNDTIDSRDADRDLVNGGAGRDTCIADPLDILVSCEVQRIGVAPKTLKTTKKK